MVRYKVVVNRASVYAQGIYQLKYVKGTVVTGLPKTLGIMVFDTYGNAEEFMGVLWSIADIKIVKVRTIGKGTRPKYLSMRINEESIRAFYTPGLFGIDEWCPIAGIAKGTMCYPAVEVLE